MQFTTGKKPAQGIVYDSDLGNSIDTALALALLHGCESKNYGRIASISVSKSNLKAAQFADILEKFYASATQAGSQGGIGPLLAGSAIGLAVDGKMTADTPILKATFAFPPRIQKLYDTAICEALMRNALTAQYDQNAVVISAGPANNLVRLLDLEGAKEIVATKVKLLAIAGGTFPSGKPDPSFTTDLKAIRRVLAEWPSPIVMCGREVGSAIEYPATSIETDFAYAPNHPIPSAYRAFHAMPYDADSTAMAAALYAVRPGEGYFKLSEPGTVKIADDGSSSFEPGAGGKHRYLIADPAAKEKVVKAYTELASAKPVVRVRRPVAVDAEVEEKDEKKPVKKP